MSSDTSPTHRLTELHRAEMEQLLVTSMLTGRGNLAHKLTADLVRAKIDGDEWWSPPKVREWLDEQWLVVRGEK